VKYDSSSFGLGTVPGLYYIEYYPMIILNLWPSEPELMF